MEASAFNIIKYFIVAILTLVSSVSPALKGIDYYKLIGVLDGPNSSVSAKEVSANSLSDQDIDKIIATHKPNEMGEVMVIMYHNLVDDKSKEGAYARTFDNFKADLERMYNEGYCPITMRELISGRIDVPAGKTPIVLTFDDGHPTDIQFTADGKISPNCVVGIFEEVKAKYPDFKPAATFYINSPVVFGDKEIDKKKVEYLLANGYEIGNHTMHHKNIRKCTTEEMQKQIVGQQDFIVAATGTKDLTFNFAVTFGEKPSNYIELVKDPKFLAPYTMTSSVNVGWNPIPSPYSVKFNPLSINRITVGDDECELHFWMNSFKDSPKKRFISDGVPGLITFPKSAEPNFNSADTKYTENFKVKSYE